MVPSPLLRPWNVGHYTGRESNVVTPLLREYVCKHPDKAIPGGEAFNSFKERVFLGLRQAIQIAGDAMLGLVTHHRVERLLAAWDEAGQQPDLAIEPDVMFTHGEAPASYQQMVLNLLSLSQQRNTPQLVPIDHDPFSGMTNEQR